MEKEGLVDTMIKWPSHDDFRKIAREFELRWQFPMAVGAVDGSHINVQVPRLEKTGYFDYKHNYSMTLMAICDANYEFYFCQCGQSGRNNDRRIWESTGAHATLVKPGSLPDSARVINGTLVPYFLLGDSAFGEHKHLITTYTHRDDLTSAQVTFNNRHSR